MSKAETPQRIEYPAEVDLWGWTYCHLLMIRLHVRPEKWKTYWHVVVWKFSIGMSFPAAIVNAFSKSDA